MAGYLERGESERSVSAGALSGLVVFAPLAAMAAFALLGLALGRSGIGEGTWVLVVGIALQFVLAVAAVVGGGLGALGGYVGGRIAEEQAS